MQLLCFVLFLSSPRTNPQGGYQPQLQPAIGTYLVCFDSQQKTAAHTVLESLNFISLT